ncbi:MAG TPA: DUF2442 domain-containing protein [Polyangia bacterium]
MLVSITTVEHRGGYRLYLRFNDGAEGEVDIAEVLPFTGVFEAFRDQAFFAQVTVSKDWGALCWPNGVPSAAVRRGVTGAAAGGPGPSGATPSFRERGPAPSQPEIAGGSSGPSGRAGVQGGEAGAVARRASASW